MIKVENVSELIEALKRMPADAKVSHIWDGNAYTQIKFIWLGRDGEVKTSDYNQFVYGDIDRPECAPLDKDDRYWSTPENIIEND